MYFEQFMNGSASMEPVSHTDILTMACEGAEFAADAEIALIEEDGRICMTMGSEGVGDALAAVADKAKEIGTKIWKWLVEFMRKVRAFVSQAIISLRSGSIMNTLKKIVAKAKAKAKNDEWKENAPKPERVTKWNVDLARQLNSIWFITPKAVEKLQMVNEKAWTKLEKATGKSQAFGTGADQDGTVNGDYRDEDGEFNAIVAEIPKIKDEDGNAAITSKGRIAAGKIGGHSSNTTWLARVDPKATTLLKLDSNDNNDQIINKAVKAAVYIMGEMKRDAVLKVYDILKLLDTEVNLVKKLCADAGKAGARELKKIKKIQKLVSKIGTTCTLYCRRQLGSYKKLTAIVIRMFSMAGSMEKDDYNED